MSNYLKRQTSSVSQIKTLLRTVDLNNTNIVLDVFHCGIAVKGQGSGFHSKNNISKTMKLFTDKSTAAAIKTIHYMMLK